MLVLREPIMIRVDGAADYGINPEVWYRVIGTEEKDGKQKVYPNGQPYMSRINLFAIINDKGEYATVYPSKCQVVIDGKPSSGTYS